MVAGWCSKLRLSCVCIGEYYYDISGIFFCKVLLPTHLNQNLSISQFFRFESNGMRSPMKTVVDWMSNGALL